MGSSAVVFDMPKVLSAWSTKDVMFDWMVASNSPTLPTTDESVSLTWNSWPTNSSSITSLRAPIWALARRNTLNWSSTNVMTLSKTDESCEASSSCPSTPRASELALAAVVAIPEILSQYRAVLFSTAPTSAWNTCSFSVVLRSALASLPSSVCTDSFVEFTASPRIRVRGPRAEDTADARLETRPSATSPKMLPAMSPMMSGSCLPTSDAFGGAPAAPADGLPSASSSGWTESMSSPSPRASGCRPPARAAPGAAPVSTAPAGLPAEGSSGLASCLLSFCRRPTCIDSTMSASIASTSPWSTQRPALVAAPRWPAAVAGSHSRATTSMRRGVIAPHGGTWRFRNGGGSE
mmetsp:Transcript_57802/g.163092  ORF Transcript_57802/g.163092 Transcript_57802/m.163092 type:complete len:350 (+) Transcript_57802:370-1419(+)